MSAQLEVIYPPAEKSAGFPFTKDGFFEYLRGQYASYCTIAQDQNADLDTKFAAAEMAMTIKKFVAERGRRV